MAIFIMVNCGGPTSSSPAASVGQLGVNSLDAFVETLFPVLRTNCKECHGSGQEPRFAVSDGLDAYDTVLDLDLVNFKRPSRSLLVSIVRGGHEGLSAVVADDIQDEIANWLESSQ